MRLIHVGLVKRSEESSDRLFHDVLGLERVASKSISAELSRQVFGVEAEHPVVLYRRGGLEIEVFVSPRNELLSPHLGHLCLEVDDLSALLSRCAAADIEVRRIPRADAAELVFLRDEDDNLFEIKQTRTAAPPKANGATR